MAGTHANSRSRRRMCASSWPIIIARSRGERPSIADGGMSTTGWTTPVTSGASISSERRIRGVCFSPSATAAPSASAPSSSGSGADRRTAARSDPYAEARRYP